MTAPLYCRACAASFALVLGTALTLSPPALARTTAERMERGAATVLDLNGGQAQTKLERMRREFPFLADANRAYAPGDVWSRTELDNRTRQLAAVAAFAAIGETAFMMIHEAFGRSRKLTASCATRSGSSRPGCPYSGEGSERV